MIKNLEFFFILTLAAVFLIIFISNLYVEYKFNDQNLTTEIANISGKQRMLSQRIALLNKNILLEDNLALKKDILNELKNITSEMESNHNVLIQYLKTVRTMKCYKVIIMSTQRI